MSLPGEDLQVDAVFIYKNSVSPRTLLDGLASDGRHVTVDRHMETGVPGVFAAGDCTGEPYQTAKAVGEGQVAALEAVRFLAQAHAGHPMKAVVHTRYGSPDVLRLMEVERPVPKDDEVLIRVHATTVNRTDCGFLRAEPFFVRVVSGLLPAQGDDPRQ